MGKGTGESLTDPKNTISQSAFKVTLGSSLTLLAGLASQLVIAWLFGAGYGVDAYLTAIVIPIYLQAVLISGLSFVLIPAFVREKSEGRDKDAWALAGTSMLIIVGFLSIITLICILYSSSIIMLIAPGFDQTKADLSAEMLRIMMFSVPLIGLSSLAIGIQNARGFFFWPAVAPALGSIGNLVIIWLGTNYIGPMVLAWGMLFSVIIQSLVVISPVILHKWERLMPLSDPRLIELIRLSLPLIFFGAISRVTPIFERYFTSGLPDGDLSYLGYSSKISKVVLAVMGSGIATALFPVMAKEYSVYGRDRLAKISTYGIRLSLALALPILIILSVTRVPLVEVLYERGAFTNEDTIMVSRVLPILLAVVVFQMLGNVIGRSFYITGDTVTVPVGASATSVLYVIFAGLLIMQGYGYFGLAIALLLQWGLLITVLIYILVKRNILIHNQLGTWLMQYIIPALVSGFVAYLLLVLLNNSSIIFQLILSILGASVTYVTLLFFIDREILLDVMDVVGLLKLFQMLNLSRYF